MKIKNTINEVLYSVLPITIIVTILHLTITPLPANIMMSFVVGVIFLIIGEILFLLGSDASILLMGELIGSNIARFKKTYIMILFGFLFGFMATVAEPDVQVLGSQVSNINSTIGRTLLVMMVSFGVGIFVAMALIRILKNIPLRRVLFFSYTLILIIAIFAPSEYLSVAFDSGGVTTGPITVPFILAFGIGVCAVRGGKNSQDDSFGLIAMASIGPIIAVLILGMVFGKPSVTGNVLDIQVEEMNVLQNFGTVLPHVALNVLVALSPIAIIFILFQIFLLKLSKIGMIKMCVGLLITFLGLTLFLTGVEGGFSMAGSYLGILLGALPSIWLLIPIGFVLGFFVVYSEPAVRVLNEQVEEVTAGYIKKQTMLYSLAIGVAISVSLSIIRVIVGFPIWYYILPGYCIALILTKYVPPIFTGIAFDSGGVASGPMAATFIMPLLIGICQSVDGNFFQDAFGVVSMVAMTPLISIQVLGLIYKMKQNEFDKKTREVTMDEIEASLDIEELMEDGGQNEE